MVRQTSVSNYKKNIKQKTSIPFKPKEKEKEDSVNDGCREGTFGTYDELLRIFDKKQNENINGTQNECNNGKQNENNNGQQNENNNGKHNENYNGKQKENNNGNQIMDNTNVILVETNNGAKQICDGLKATIEQTNLKLDSANKEIEDRNKLDKTNNEIEKNIELVRATRLQETEKLEINMEQEQSKNALENTNYKLEEKNIKLEETYNELGNTNNKLKEATDKLEETHNELERTYNKLEKTNNKLEKTNNDLKETNNKLHETKNKLHETTIKLEETNELTVTNQAAESEFKPTKSNTKVSTSNIINPFNDFKTNFANTLTLNVPIITDLPQTLEDITTKMSSTSKQNSSSLNKLHSNKNIKVEVICEPIKTERLSPIDNKVQKRSNLVDKNQNNKVSLLNKEIEKISILDESESTQSGIDDSDINRGLNPYRYLDCCYAIRPHQVTRKIRSYFQEEIEKAEQKEKPKHNHGQAYRPIRKYNLLNNRLINVNEYVH